MGENNKVTDLQKQRGWVRLECRVPVHYRIDSEKTLKAGLARDIGEGGVKFEADRRVPPQTILWLAIQLPVYIKPLKTKAEVVSVCETGTVGSYEIGVRFLDMGKTARSRIARYIDDIMSEVEGEEDIDETTIEGLKEREVLTAPDIRQVEVKEEKGPDISALIKEIEALEMIFDEENGTCQLGKLATLSCRTLKGCPPLMLGIKFREAVGKPLLKKYGLDEKEGKKVMERCKKKFKALGTRYYIHTLKTSHEA